MTRDRNGASRRVPRAWLLPLLGLVVILGSAYLNWLSRSLLADLIAWWPLWVALLAAVYLVRGRSVGPVLLSGLVPLLALGCLLVFLVGHLAGWSTMPSSASRLVGPSTDMVEVAAAALSAHPGGELRVEESNSGFLYTVLPIRRGGEVGLPTATEQTGADQIGIALHPQDDPGWYVFAGWQVSLDPGVTWDLSLGGAIEAELAGLSVAGLQLVGAGSVELGPPTGSAPVTVSGDFRLSIPAGAPARIIGDATVPEGWTREETGWESPQPGEGWVVSVAEGSSLEVVES